MPINDHEQFLYLSVAIAREPRVAARRWQGVYSAYLDQYLVAELPRPSQAKAALCLLYERYAYSAEPGHPLRRKLGTCSNANWTRVPGQTGHYGRSDAGSMFGFYSWSVCAVKRARIFRMESPFNVS